jgi:Flp pilus assembly protein TadG
MIGRIARTLRRLSTDTSGNAMLLMAISMPVLVGGAGMAVDVSQWYTWKRELQLASDQAALAAAWARTSVDTQDTWEARGLQDYNANLSVTKTFATAPKFKLANYSNGNNNSVVVTASATKALTFTSLFLSQPVTVSTYSQASFSKGANYSACLIAVGKDGTTFSVGGNATFLAKCGLAALSCSDDALVIDASADVTTDSIAVCGTAEVPDELKSVLNENVEGLQDAFADLTPPTNNTPRTYSCVNGSTTATTATTQTDTSTVYTYWKGANTGNPGNLTATTYSPAKSPTSTTGTPTTGAVATGTVAGTTTGYTDTYTQVGGSGSNKIFERKRVTSTTTTTNVVPGTTAKQASPLPGTYSDITVKCTTVFGKGIYVVDGGTLDMTGNYTVTGTNVMFVLKNGATLKLGGSGNGNTLSLTPMQASDFLALGYSATLSNRYANMLIFEDRNNDPKQDHIINGNSTSLIQGTIYLPAGTARVNGTASLDSSCLQISANKINILGNAYLDTRCPTAETNSAGSSIAKVRLVA